MTSTLYVGIDEAGLGPTLGPMLHGWSAYRSNSIDIEVAMNELKLLCQTIGIAPNDSKKIFSGTNKHEKLSSCLAGILSLFPIRPVTLSDLILNENLNTEGDHSLYPTYINLFETKLPMHSSSLPSNLSGGITIMLEGELNHCLARGYNKSSAALLKIGKIIDHLLETHVNDNIYFLIDKQGGRNFYFDFLADIFPFRNIETIVEGHELSQYAIRNNDSSKFFYFIKKGDSKYLTISIASILAKWARELYMNSFNLYWNKYNTVEHTAGYPLDAKRFIEEMKSFFEKSNMPIDRIIRRK